MRLPVCPYSMRKTLGAALIGPSGLRAFALLVPKTAVEELLGPRRNAWLKPTCIGASIHFRA